MKTRPPDRINLIYDEGDYVGSAFGQYARKAVGAVVQLGRRIQHLGLGFRSDIG